MVGSPDFFLFALAVVKGCVQGVGDVFTMVKHPNSVTHLLKSINNIVFILITVALNKSNINHHMTPSLPNGD